MPLVKVEPPVQEQDDDDIKKFLFKDDGSLTLEGEIIAAFLEDVDFDPVFDDPEVREAGLVTTEAAKAVDQDGEFIEADEKDEKAVEVTVETIAPEDMAEIIDLDDLAMMFEYYVENEMPSETLEDKARLATAKAMLDLDEARAKRTFKNKYGTIGPAGNYTRAKVNSMLWAMMNKGAIQRASTPGSGYDGGDYKKKSGGYGAGSGKKLMGWQKFTGRLPGKKVKAKVAASAKKLGKKSAKIGKAASAKKGAAAKLKGKKAKKGKAISAGEQQVPAKLNEGATLASRMIGKMHESSLAPKQPDAEKK